MVERLLRRAAGIADLPWVVTSAGTHAQAGQPCHPYAVRTLAERALDLTDFRSTELTLDRLAEADLVLTADLEQRRWIAALDPTAVPRTVPLRAMAAWLEAGGAPEGPGFDGAGLLARALAGRARRQPLTPEQQSLRDPLGHGMRHFRRCADEVEAAVAVLVARA